MIKDLRTKEEPSFSEASEDGSRINEYEPKRKDFQRLVLAVILLLRVSPVLMLTVRAVPQYRYFLY